MFAKHWARFGLVAALVMLLGLLTPAFSLAAGPGSSPDTAVAPTGGMVHLNAGQQHWYVFHIDGTDKDSTPNNVTVSLFSTSGNVGFNIWTPQELSDLPSATSDSPINPVGRGTVRTVKENDQTVVADNGILHWADRTRVGGTFYVQVFGGQPSDYQLQISGNGVSFPTQYVLAQPSQQTPRQAGPSLLPLTGSSPSVQAARPAAPAQAIQPAFMGSNSMDNAFALAGTRTMSIGTGQQQWFAFQIGEPSDSDSKPRVAVTLSTLSGGPLSFQVWTAQRLSQFNSAGPDDKKVGAVGMGTPFVTRDSDGNRTTVDNGQLFWLGDGRSPGTFYIVVTAGSNSRYTLSINNQ